MADLLIQDINDDVIETFKIRAQLNRRTLEEEIRHLLNSQHMKSPRPYTPEERVTASRAIRAQTKGIVPSLSNEEIREGLE